MTKSRKLKKFKALIENWAEGTQPLARNLPPVMFYVCVELYNALLGGESPTFRAGSMGLAFRRIWGNRDSEDKTMRTTKDRMLRYRVMEEHMRLVRDGLYLMARRILDLLQRGSATPGFGDVDWAVEDILTKLGCHITIAGRHHLATAYLYCSRTR